MEVRFGVTSSCLLDDELPDFEDEASSFLCEFEDELDELLKDSLLCDLWGDLEVLFGVTSSRFLDDELFAFEDELCDFEGDLKVFFGVTSSCLFNAKLPVL